MSGLKRIIMHWTAGAYGDIADERRHYHALVLDSGRTVLGDLHPEANESTADGRYAAHTRACNTGSIGIAMDAMAGAMERPFVGGRYPITEAQLAGFVATVADYAATYGIPVSRETVLSHAEVGPTLGIAQRGKWDITWLPGMDAPGDPIAVGDQLRDMIAGKHPSAAGTDEPADDAPTAPALPRLPMARGERGPDVRSLQTLLALAGHSPGKVDGDFGPKTEQAVIAFQRAWRLAGLVTLGIVNVQTAYRLAWLAALNRA